jgi:hypothetical protein
MAMQLQDLRNLTLYWLDDLSGGYFTSTQVNLWLNNAQRECQKQLLQAGQNYYLKPSQTSTVKNQSDYVLPSDFLKLHRLELITSGTGVNEVKKLLNSISLNEQMDISTGTGTPDCYILKKNRLTLYRTPDSAKTLRLYYSTRVADMINDTDVPDLPEEFEEFLPIMAAIDGLVKDNRSSPTLAAKYQMYIDRFKQMANDRKQDRSRRVIVRDELSYGDFY